MDRGWYSIPNSPRRGTMCTYSRSSKEGMSRARSDLSPPPRVQVSEELFANKERMYTVVEPCLAGAKNALIEDGDNRMKSRSCVFQCVGFCLSFLGWMCSLATTVLRDWMSMNNDLVLTEEFFIGIWEACVAQEEGNVQCKAYDSIFTLPEDIQLARIFMCTSIAFGLLSLVLSLSGSTSVTCCGDDNAKKGRLMVCGGVLAILAGVTTLIPVSYVAHLTVLKFWNADIPDFVPRWEFGQALFVGWAGGFLLLLGGLLLIIAQCCFRKPKSKFQLKPPLQTARRQLWYKVEYV
ncbi:putative claudin-24 [Leucoraja erinacea]|uniref:putative claudin-24 n=1 Tax=Leucoraja erinaceus TaxID=7782 RepID=UPI0024572516|nr:putative claudin-24 [Leucoraja erinacea]